MRFQLKIVCMRLYTASLQIRSPPGLCAGPRWGPLISVPQTSCTSYLQTLATPLLVTITCRVNWRETTPLTALTILLYKSHFAGGKCMIITLLGRLSVTATITITLHRVFSKHFLRRLCTDFLETSPHDLSSSSVEKNSLTFVHWKKLEKLRKRFIFTAMHVALARYCNHGIVIVSRPSVYL